MEGDEDRKKEEEPIESGILDEQDFSCSHFGFSYSRGYQQVCKYPCDENFETALETHERRFKRLRLSNVEKILRFTEPDNTISSKLLKCHM
jgi:hypothetical protein